MIPGEETIKVKSSKTFSLNIVTTPDDATTPGVDEGEDYLPPLPAIAPLGNYKATWLVNETVGGTAKFGKIVPGENKSQATYTAPGLLPAEYAVKVKLKVSLYITNKEKTTKAGKRTGKMIKMQQTRLEDQKTFVSIISLFDEYDVKIDALVDNTNLGPFTQKWTDESSFRLRVGKDPGISNISNNVYKLVKENFTNNKCQFVYRNSATCKGPIHVTGTIGVGLSGGSASRYATAMVDFAKVPWELPNLQITCPGGSIPTMVFPGPAFPHKMKFELKTGTFTEEYVGAADFFPAEKLP